jgi:diguanylate cyclase (GGDEF)-like protein
LELDVRTLFLAATITTMFAGLTMVSASGVMELEYGPRRFGLGLTFLGMGLFGLVMRGAMPDWVTYPLANSVIVAGFATMYEGVRVIYRRASHLKLILMVTGAITVFYFLVDYGESFYSIRVAVLALSAAISLLASAVIAVRHHEAADRRASLVFAAVLTFFGLAGTWRVIAVAFLNREPVSSALQNTNEQGALSLLVMLMPLLFTGCVVLVVSSRTRVRLVNAAQTDGLTGTLNRQALGALGARAFASIRAIGKPCTVMMLDLDYFKNINDTHGHPAGDQVLHAVAQALVQVLPARATIGRYGGEEFAAVFVADLTEARELAQQLLEAIRKLRYSANGERFKCTASIGMYVVPADAHIDFKTAISTADQALYRAKDLGRDRAVVG